MNSCTLQGLSVLATPVVLLLLKFPPRDTLNIFSKASSGLFLIYKVEVFDELCQAIYRINIQGIAVY